jgi:ketosteroid isomerase-like protein
MSEENVELVERFFDAWDRQDLGACLASADPEIEYVNAPFAVEPGTRHGHEGFSLVLRKQWEGLGASAHIDVEEAHVQGDAVLAIVRLSREMPGGGSQIEIRAVLRMTFRNGRILRVEPLGAGTSFDAGLKAAGLAE